VCFIPSLNLPNSQVLQTDFKTKKEPIVINFLEISFVVYFTTPSVFTPYGVES